MTWRFEELAQPHLLYDFILARQVFICAARVVEVAYAVSGRAVQRRQSE